MGHLIFNFIFGFLQSFTKSLTKPTMRKGSDNMNSIYSYFLLTILCDIFQDSF